MFFVGISLISRRALVNPFIWQNPMAAANSNSLVVYNIILNIYDFLFDTFEMLPRGFYTLSQTKSSFRVGTLQFKTEENTQDVFSD